MIPKENAELRSDLNLKSAFIKIYIGYVHIAQKAAHFRKHLQLKNFQIKKKHSINFDFW